MWENEESDVFEEAEKRIDTVLEEIYLGSINWLFDLKNNLLRPLHKVEIRDKELIATFDLPGVKKEDISISATERSLSIQAAMQKPIRLMVGATFRNTSNSKDTRKPSSYQPKSSQTMQNPQSKRAD
jgi:HSP20 family molecular chaperone IbpA